MMRLTPATDAVTTDMGDATIDIFRRAHTSDAVHGDILVAKYNAGHGLYFDVLQSGFLHLRNRESASART